MYIDEDTTFDDLCDEIESYGKEKCMDLGFSSTVKVFKKLNDADGKTFSDFILMCIASDGYLTIEEYYYSKPLLSILLAKRNVSFDDASNVIRIITRTDNGKEIKENVMKRIRDLLSRVDKETKEDMLMSGLLATACDGKLSESERQFIMSLFGKN